MKQFQFDLSPNEIKNAFTEAYDISKPLCLLLFDGLGIQKGTYCRIKGNRFWLFRTVQLHFFPKKHFSGVLSGDETQSKTRITGRFVYSPWYLIYPIAVFLLFFLAPSPPEQISGFKYLIICLLMTGLFVLFTVLIAGIHMKPREQEMLAEMEAVLEEAQKNRENTKVLGNSNPLSDW